MVMMMSKNNDDGDSVSFFNGLKRTLKLKLLQDDIQTQLFQLNPQNFNWHNSKYKSDLSSPDNSDRRGVLLGGI